MPEVDKRSAGGEEINMNARPRGTDQAKLVTLIETSALCGYGSAGDPCYIQRQYWSLDGKLVAIGIGESLKGRVLPSNDDPPPSERPSP